MDSKLFNVNLEQISESQYQRALATIYDTRITCLVVIICTWVIMDIHGPLMKERNDTNNNEWGSQDVFNNCRYSSWTASYHNLNFSETIMKASPIQAANTQEIIGLDKQTIIWFARLCKIYIRNNPEIFEQVVLSEECKISLSRLVNEQTCREWVLNFEMNFIECKLTVYLLWFAGQYWKRSNWALLLNPEMWPERFTKGFLGTKRFRNLR